MTTPANILQTVQTYQMGGLAYLLNLNCFLSTCNTRFKDFNKMTANLGDAVTFDLPPRARSINNLVVTFEAAVQRVQTLVCDQQQSYAITVTSQQQIFNLEQNEYIPKFVQSGIYEIGAAIESNIAQNAITHTYRYFGTPSSPVNSFGSLAQALANYRDYGSTYQNLKVYLPVTDVPTIVNSGLNQFVMDRNEEQAMSWFIGNWMGVEFYQSNLLPTQIAGNVGNNGTVLTLVSTNDPTGQNVTQLTFSGATVNDVNAIFANDKFTFQDGVSGLPNLRFLTFTGHIPSSQPVQFRATAAAAADGSGDVVVNIYPPLVSFQNLNQNLNVALQAGMQVKGLASARYGMIVGGDALFVAMPQLPDQSPFYTANEYDDSTGMSMRHYFGTLFGQNQQGYVVDAIWGSTLVDEYAMALPFPL